MVIKGLCRISVLTETLALRIIVIIIDRTHPVIIAFNAEMVIGINRQFTLSGTGLQQGLRHDDRSRNTIGSLVLDSGIFPLFDIIEIRLVLRHKTHRAGPT